MSYTNNRATNIFCSVFILPYAYFTETACVMNTSSQIINVNITPLHLLILRKHDELTNGKEQNFYETYDNAGTNRRL